MSCRLTWLALSSNPAARSHRVHPVPVGSPCPYVHVDVTSIVGYKLSSSRQGQWRHQSTIKVMQNILLCIVLILTDEPRRTSPHPFERTRLFRFFIPALPIRMSCELTWLALSSNPAARSHRAHPVSMGSPCPYVHVDVTSMM